MQKPPLIGEYITAFTIATKQSWNKHNKEVKDLYNTNFEMLMRKHEEDMRVYLNMENGVRT